MTISSIFSFSILIREVFCQLLAKNRAPKWWKNLIESIHLVLAHGFFYLSINLNDEEGKKYNGLFGCKKLKKTSKVCFQAPIFRSQPTIPWQNLLACSGKVQSALHAGPLCLHCRILGTYSECF